MAKPSASTIVVRLLIVLVVGALLFVAFCYEPARYVEIRNKYSTRPDNAEFVLFVGNSHLFVHHVPYIVQKLVPETERPLAFEALLSPGATLTWHINRGDVAWYGEQEQYDVVVIQPQSTELLDNDNFAAQTTRLAALSRADRTIAMQTWPRTEKDEWARYLGIDMTTWNTTTWEAVQGNWTSAPVGNAFECVFNKTRIDLWSPDGNHASLAGAFVAGATLYHTLRGSDAPRTEWAPNGLPPKMAEQLGAALDSCIK